jgi:hypothetical protein
VRHWLFRGKVVIATKFGLPYGENGDQGVVVHPHLTWLTPTPNADISMAPQEARDQSGRGCSRSLPAVIGPAPGLTPCGPLED